jgi:hypothetical protein
MKKVFVILSLIAIFAACKKEQMPSPGQYNGCYLDVTLDYTLNFKYVKDCSMRPVAEGTQVMWGSNTLRMDSTGNCLQKYKITLPACRTNRYSPPSFYAEGLPRNFLGIEYWEKEESFLMVQNESMTVNVQFKYSEYTAALLKDSLKIGYGTDDSDIDEFYKKIPEMTKDSTFDLKIVGRNRLYWKNRNGNYQLGTGLRIKLGRKNFESATFISTTGFCGIDSIIIR